MKKNFKIDIDTFNQTNNDMDDIYEGNTLNSQDNSYMMSNDNKNKVNNDIIKKKATNIDHTKTIDNKGRVNKKNNYAINVKIDEDLKEYLTKIEWILYFSNKQDVSKNKYINNLIRQDMLKRLNLKDNATYEQVQTAWDNYKKTNNI